ncbi:MAG: transposase [Gammaproteobacteria bacterium]|nr:transposase [Gammaproteobacteria bacterium]
MNHTLTLTDEKVLEAAQATLGDYLDLHAEGYKCATTDLLNVLLAVAADRGTIESVCTDLVGTPDPETIRGYLNEQLCVEDLPELEAAVNKALVAQLPPRLGRRAQDIAMDLHDRPYYGKQTQDAGLWVRGRAKDGTTRFYRIATAYILRHNLRFTLGICFVLPEMDTVKVLQRLLQRVQALHLPLRRLLLDRGFASIAVQEYLDQQQIPAVIACPIRGKTGGTRALCRGRKSYRTQHTFQGANATSRIAELVICRVFTTAKRTKRLQRRADWQVFILIHLDLSPRQVRRLYRRRFGIETSYRCASKVRGWTTSSNPTYRFLLMALGVLLVNVWVILRWLFTQLPRRGGRKLDVRRFQLDRFAKFILRALQRHYGCVHQIAATVAPLM